MMQIQIGPDIIGSGRPTNRTQWAQATLDTGPDNPFESFASGIAQLDDLGWTVRHVLGRSGKGGLAVIVSRHGEKFRMGCDFSIHELLKVLSDCEWHKATQEVYATAHGLPEDLKDMASRLAQKLDPRGPAHSLLTADKVAILLLRAYAAGKEDGINEYEEDRIDRE